MASSSFRQLIRSIPLFRIQSTVASTVTNSAKLSASLRCYHHLKPICFKTISPATNSLSPAVSASVNKIQIRCAHKPALTYDYIRERILLVLRLYDKIDPDQLKLDSHFTKDLGLDSLDHVELIMAIEDEFQFEIPDQDAEKLNTPEDILKYISIKEEIYPELEHRDDHGEGHH